MYRVRREDLMPPRLATFYDRLVPVPNRAEAILRYVYGPNCLDVIYDKYSKDKLDARVFSHMTAHVDWDLLDRLHRRIKTKEMSAL